MPASRRLSHHISQGDGIAVIVHVPDASAARAAEEQGAKALGVDGPIEGIREATTLPLLWRGRGIPADADALAIRAGDEDGTRRELELVVDVRDEDELEEALERLDPEIFLHLARAAATTPRIRSSRCCELLPDVPAGKLAIADVAVASRDEVLQLERAGFDAVLIPNGSRARARRNEPARRLSRRESRVRRYFRARGRRRRASLCAGCGGDSGDSTSTEAAGGLAPLSTLGPLEPAPPPGKPGGELVPIPDAPALAPAASKATADQDVDGIKCEHNAKLVFHVHSARHRLRGRRAAHDPGRRRHRPADRPGQLPRRARSARSSARRRASASRGSRRATRTA